MADVKQFAPGVTLYEGVYWDTYQGDVDVLVAAGVVQADRVPGAPGQNKTSMVLSPDGNARRPGSKFIFGSDRAGCKRILRRGSKALEVHVWVSAEVSKARRAEEDTREARAQLQRAQQPAANDEYRRWYRKGWEAACAVVEHRGYPAPTWDGSPRAPRPRPVVSAGWSVIRGGRHA